MSDNNSEKPSASSKNEPIDQVDKNKVEKNQTNNEQIEKEQTDQTEKESKELNKSKNEKTLKKDKGKAQDGEKDSGTWTPVWDDNYKAYYWWNTVSNETTWSDPNVVGPDQEAKQNLEEQEKIKNYTKSTQAASSQPYFPTTDYTQLYTSQAHFNSRTGRFTAQEDFSRLNPESMSIENRATRQMQFYFDVDAYTEQRNKQKMMEQGVKRKLTRKEVEYFKKMKQEKKNKRAREWLLQ